MSLLRRVVSICRHLLIPAFFFAGVVSAQTPSGDVVIASNTTWPSASYALSSLTVQSGAVLTVGGGSTVTVANGVTVTGISSIVLQGANNTGQVNGAWAGAGVTLQAGSVQVDSGSSINADGQGYLSSAARAGSSASGGSGGSYGGLGGYNPGPLYGSATAPSDLGSGGVAAQYYGGTGGGAVRLIVSGALTNNGSISANGEAVNTTCNCGGGGAGGSVWVTAGSLAGSGKFTANGGSNLSTSGAGAAAGGGGRVAVYYAGPSTFSGFATSTASGGTYTGSQAGYAGASGTAAFFDTSAQNSNVSVYGSGFQLPANTTVQYNTLTIANNAAVTIGAGSSIALSSLMVQSGAVLTVGGGSAVTVANGVTVTGNSNIVLQGANNTGQVNGAWAGVGVKLQAGSMQVDSGSSISADGQGYLSSAGRAEADGASNSSGGSYGGKGGNQAGTTYGSASAPFDLGSGGEASQYYGGTGGGAIRLIVSGVLTNNGTVSANGDAVNTTCNCGGGGAGGSVWVTAGSLAGSGKFTANGGSNLSTSGTGAAAGGGGRVAVYYAGPTTFSGFQSSTASGGTYTGPQAGYTGTNGTAVFFDTSAANGNATVYQHFEVPANTSVQYNALTVAQGASVTLGGGSQMTVVQALQVTGTITAQSTNSTAQVNGKWVGKGAVIAAGSLQIDATGSINADAQGYPQDAGPGAGSYTSGGSYGGLGGGQAGTTAYGSLQSPVDLGSGGGSGQNTGGGTGGGAIELLVAGTLTNNGSITANGGSISQSGYGGAGAGGSIFVQTRTLQGSGTVTANGGSNTSPNNAGSGGGGGRISVQYLINSGFALSALTVNPGTGANVGTAGTVNFVQAAGLQWLKPSGSVVHGAAAMLQWSTNAGSSTAVNAAGPQTGLLATGGVGISSATWDTTAFPDGVYELRLTASNSSGVVGSVSTNVVVNNAVQWVSGTLTANTHWTADKVYALDANLIVPSGITLTIDPGTVIKALDNVQIIVQGGGTLTALGAVGSPVVFTTFDDSSVGGNTSFSSGVPQPGDWAGINVASGGTFNNNTNTYVLYSHGTLGTTLAADTTLTSSQAYEIPGTVTVPSGVTLTIQPGAVLKFDSGAGIVVSPGGRLIADGTLSQPIYLTSINDQSVGANLIAIANPSAPLTAPAPGDWNSIRVEGTASFNFVHMLYGGGPIPTTNQEGMLESANGGTVTLSNSTLAYSYYIGIQTGLSGTGDTYTITNTTFFGNQDRAINVYGGSTVHVVNCTFDGNAAGPFNHGGAMDIANSVITGFTNAQFGGVGGPVSPFVNNDVYTTAAGVANYTGGLSDQTGTNGNISAAPIYGNAAQHDYRPNYGSPLIDAANGTVANYPATDAFNNARYNAPLVTAKKGAADANGKYPDIGALEFVRSAPSNLDLTVSAVQGPSSAVVGSQVQVTWTVTNVGSGMVYGPWHDAVYLVRNPQTVPIEMYAGQVLSGQNVTLGPGATYSGTATVTVPGSVVGEASWEVKTNVLGEVFEGMNTANNSGVSLNPVQVDVPALNPGTPVSGSFSTVGQAVYYKVTPSATQTTRLQLALQSPATGSVQLFVGGGYVPSPQRYDYQQAEFNSATATVVIPAGTDQTYYVTAYPQVLTSSPTSFTVTAANVSFSLNSVNPSSASAGGNATLTFSGGNFTTNTAFQLVSGSGVVYTPASTLLFASDTAVATFDLTRVPAGSYTVRAVDGTALSLTNVFTVTAASTTTTTTLTNAPGVEVTLETPSAFRAGFPSLVTLHYRSTASTDIPAPILYLSANNATLAEVPPQCNGCDANFAAKAANTFNTGLVLGINREGPAGVLPPGGSGSIPFVAMPLSNADVTFSASASALDPVAFTYDYLHCLSNSGVQILCRAANQTGAYGSASEFCSSLVPAGEVINAGFLRACMQMLNNAGYTYVPFVYVSGNFPAASAAPADGFSGPHMPLAGWNKLLADAATALSASGDYEYDTQKLLAYELQKDGAAELSARYHQGAFGYGRSHPFDITLSVSLAGYPVVTYPDGTARAFATASGTQANTFLGPVGDYATITRDTSTSSGDWLVTEADGSSSHFIGRGDSNALGAYDRLDFIQDKAGNKLQMTYTGSTLTGVTDSFGNTIAYQYDSLGHIVSAMDPVGRKTTYTYDNVVLNTTLGTYGSFLTSATDAAGTTRFAWNEGGTAHPVGYFDDSCIATFCDAPIGVNTITFPDGTHTYFTYDTAGRLTGSSHDGGTEALTYSHNSDGSATVTDALGHTTTTKLNIGGHATSVIDPLGNLNRLRYDAEGKIIADLGPLGDSSSFGFDALGNQTSLVLPTGSSLSYAFGLNAQLTSLTDSIGSIFAYTSDASGNVTAQADPSGRALHYTYDANGRVLNRTNRRGQTTSFTYNTAGQIASVTLSTGTSTTFLYDAHGNPQSITGPSGTTRYDYDAADRLTGVTNPDGTTLTYTYNSGGQLTSLRDSTGFITNYSYDSAGRLAALTNGGNASVVSYAYDAAGRLTAKSFGNGASTSIGYDAAGDKTSVAHFAPGHAALSEYDYTYDANRQPITEKTPFGTMTYGYNLDGALISVTTPAGPVQYNYDANGNRTSVTSNGSAELYTTNNLGEYTSAGGTAYAYDADGNMVSDGTYTYTYNELGWMLSATGANDAWTYTYDGRGARIASTHNGTTTRYLNDVAGTVLATFDGSGALQSHYVYGLDLTSAVSSSGTPSYYHFDATGNTTQITNVRGTVVNSYVYLPFGEYTTLAAGVTNPFTYSGSAGVVDDGAGLYRMRNRWYSPVLGRFVQQDPSGQASDPNLYRYALNSPVQYSDPSGLDTVSDVVDLTTDSTGVHIFNAVAPQAQNLVSALGTTYHAVEGSTPGAIKLSSVESRWAGNTNNAISIVGAISTTTSLANNIKNGDWWGVLHDSALNTCTALDAVSDIIPPVGPGKVLKFVVHNASTIDEVSQKLSTGFANWYYEPESPFAQPPRRPGQRLPQPCGSCLTKPGQKRPVKVNGSIDPNAKIASGFGDQGFIPPSVPITYTIYFENLPTATLPAQKVVVTDQLAANLDWSTVQLQQVNLNNVSLQVPEGTQSYRTQASVSTDNNPVSVAVALNPSTGLLTWTLQSVNATTWSAPADPLAGFLPPNNASNAGVGSVVFSVYPKSGLSNGTTIVNQATIVFDANASIATNTVTNTMDSSPVSSFVAPLPATTPATSSFSFPVNWSGSDTGGSGIASYDIYVSIDGGPFLQWLSSTALTSASFTPAHASHSYSFVSVATSNVGLVQTTPAQAQTTTVVLQKPGITVTPASVTTTATQPLTVTVSVTGTGTPTGSVTLASRSHLSGSVPLVSGTVTIAIPAGTLSTGSNTLTAVYEPDTAGGLVFKAASGTAVVTLPPTVTSTPFLTLSPGSLAFTAISGQTSAVQTVVLGNTGAAVLNIAAIAITGTGASAFTQTNNCAATLSPGATCSVAVTFTPSSVASFTAALSVSSNATGSGSTVAISGTATAPPTFTMSVTPASQTIAAGGTATYQVSLTPQGGAFSSVISLSTSGFPSGATAVFAPATVTPGSASATSTLTIRLSQNSSSVKMLGRTGASSVLAFGGCFFIAIRGRRRLASGLIAVCILLYLTAGLTGCGSSRRQSSADSTITITASSGQQTQTLTVSLKVR